MTLHTTCGYEYSSVGASRTFNAGDEISNKLGGDEIVHRRYLHNGKRWQDKDFTPSIEEQSVEHKELFTYSHRSGKYTLNDPEYSHIEDNPELPTTEGQDEVEYDDNPSNETENSYGDTSRDDDDVDAGNGDNEVDIAPAAVKAVEEAVQTVKNTPAKRKTR